MKKARRVVALLLALVLTLAIGVSASAEDNYKQKVLDYMASEAAKVNVPESNARYQNAVSSVKNYTGNFTEEQYNAAIAEIDYIRDQIAGKGNYEGVAAMNASDKEAFFSSLGKHLEDSAAKVGVTVGWKTDGHGWVINPIKQTGASFGSTLVLIVAAISVLGGCAVYARKKELFA